MKERQVNQALLACTTISLLLGFLNENFWALTGLFGLIPSIFALAKDIRNKTMGSDLLAALSLVATLLTAEFFAAAIIALMLATGRMLESWATGQAERQLKSLISRMPRIANRIDEINGEKKLTQVAIEKIQIGDHILIRSGEITPTDGKLLTSASLDESALTGEPLPVQKNPHDYISSGVLNAGGPFEYLASTTSEESTYEGIIKLVEAAHAKSAPGVRLANTWAMRFVPIALVVAGAAWIITGDIDRAVAVLVAATPCPLILAVPIAIVAGLSQSAKNGAVIKGGAILELLSRAETVLLDKTGTLTKGGPAISEISSAPGFTSEQIIEIAASLDQYSPHIVAHAIVKYAHANHINFSTCSEITEIPGHQISGFLNGKEVTVGQLTEVAPTWMKITKPLIVAISQDGQLIGALGLEDPLRAEAKDLIHELRVAGVDNIALVTGDREETANLVAEQLGITMIYSNATAAQKLEITQHHMTHGQGAVIVVGDGINDAPALAAAHVGVAMGAKGASAASEAADVIIVDDSIERLTRAIKISKRARKKAIQAALLGMTLSFFIMTTGALGVTSASQGALAQEAIDILAILWGLTTLRGIKFKS